MFFKSRKTEQTDAQEIPQDPRLMHLDWDTDINLLLRESNQRLKNLLNYAGVIIVLLIVAIVGLTPLKSTIPYVYEVDKLTGEVSVVQTVKDYVKTTELNDKYWVKRFLTSRERYNFKLIQADYDFILLTASDNVFSAYAANFEGPNSVEKKYGDNVLITPEILSISLTQGNLATVRFETRHQDLKPGGETKVKRWVALIKYEYKTRTFKKESELIDNPLGFNVVGYQVDPELTGLQ